MKYTHILLLILSLLVNNCYSILKLRDNFNNELSSFYNVDLPKINNASYVKITGNLLVASFNNKDDPCKISEMPNNVDVLVVPFQRAFKLGCKSYANLLTSNSLAVIIKTILNQNPTNLKDTIDDNDHINLNGATTVNIPQTSIIESSIIQKKDALRPSPSHSPSSINSIETEEIKESIPILPNEIKEIITKKYIQKVSKRIEDKVINRKREFASNAPKIVIFSSSHNGIPGLREQYYGDVNILRTATPSLTLINIEDAEKLIEIANKVTYVEVTTEQGPWIRLLQSKPWKAFSIVMGVLYLFIAMITLYLTPRTYMNLGCVLSNPKFWVYPGLGIISTFSFIILEIDPGDIYQDKISIFVKGILYDSKNFLIAILYTIIHLSWRIVAKRICRERLYRPFLIVDTHNIFKIIQLISASTFIMCFILRIVYENKSRLEVVYIVESAALGFIGLGLLVFGTLIILALRRLRRRRNITRIAWSQKQSLRVVLMILFMVISIVLYIGSQAFTFLVLTIEIFKIEQVSHNVITVFCCITMILVLEDRYIGRYLPSNRDNENSLNPVITLTSITSSDGPTQSPPLPGELEIDIDPDRIELEEVNPEGLEIDIDPDRIELEEVSPEGLEIDIDPDRIELEEVNRSESTNV